MEEFTPAKREERKPMTALFLMAGMAAVMMFGAHSQTKQLKAALVNKMPPAQYLPKVISLALVTAQISELVKLVEHATITHIAAALLLFAIVLATRSGTESEIH